jgi:hypothetical protein
MKKENKTEHCNWRFLVSVFLYFLSIFYILTCIISFCRETGKGIEHTWFWEDEGEDDGGAGFSASPCPLFLFGLIPLLSLLLSQYFSAPSYFLRFPPKLFHSYFFQCSLSSLCLFLPPAFGSSSGFNSQRTQVFLVSQRASRWRGLLMKVFDECVMGEENSQNEKLREELRSWEKRTELYSCYFTCRLFVTTAS